MGRSRKLVAELGAVCVLLILPLILFWPVTLGSKTLIPADNLYQWEPYRAAAAEQGVPLPPHNELLSDLVLENLAWKQFIVQSIQNREIPLWNPYLFAGVPFLAAGQHSALYPLSVLFYILPLTRAYGVFTVLQLWLAGVFMYVFARVLRMGRFPALIAGITYQLSAFFVVSVVFTMIIAAAAWLPLLLAIVEVMVRKQEEKGTGPFVPIVYVALGSVALGLHVLAGHPEILVYTLMVVAFYALVRLVMLWRRVGRLRPALRLGGWLGVMAGLGLALGSVQLIPLVELVTRSFREGSVTYADVVGWAYPSRQIITFVVPDFFGNPAQHGYWDLVSRQWVSVDRIFWGIKNYVEAGSYAGILPLLLAAVAVLPAGLRRSWSRRRQVWIFAALAAISLLLIFGTPLYALLYYGLPGVKQLHSPFRWVFPYTLSVAVLAGFGAERLVSLRRDSGIDDGEKAPGVYRPWVSILTWGSFWGGVVLLAGLALVLVVPGPFASLAGRVLDRVEAAQQAFSSGQMLLSYEWRNLLVFGLMLVASGIVLRVSRCPIYIKLPRFPVLRPRASQPVPNLDSLLPGSRIPDSQIPRLRIPVWQPLAVIVVAVDLLVFGAGFNPTADPAWLQYSPPPVGFLQTQAAAEQPWRLTTYQVEGATKTLNANIPWLKGVQDVRGYDSIIPRQYVEYMRAIEGQGELLYNRIAPIYGAGNLDSPLLDLLGVRYVATEGEIVDPKYKLAYDGEIRIYENTGALPRAFALPNAELASDADLPTRLSTFDPRTTVLLDPATLANTRSPAPDTQFPFHPATVVTYSPNTVFVDVEMPGPGWLVLADSYFPGWKAYRSNLIDPITNTQYPITNPQDEPDGETELQILRADGNFRAVYLEAGAHRVRFVYTPMSFKLGLYGSFMAGVVLLLLLLYWLWTRFYRERDDDPAVKRVAKNSLLPMGLQLLNRLIDFAFAMVMYRILAPTLVGRYDFAVAFIGYFDILARFGLGTLLTREVAKERSQANRYLNVVSILRIALWLVSLPLMTLAILVYLLLSGGLTTDIVLAIAFFAVGLVFSNFADGFSAVFYAYEKMEYPAAIATVTALTRVSLGVLVLLAGWGIVGLAGVSVAANVVSATVLGALMVRHCFKPRFEWDAQTGKWMLNTSFPLMINLFLATAFFRIDVLLLKPFKGDAAVGYYGAAYRYLNGLNIIPSFFTLAVFPMMSRYAASGRDSLVRAYVLSLRLLLLVAMPIAAGTPFIARELILLLAGSKFLPDSTIALQLIIWFLPLSFVNSVTQYVLIAIDQQRFLTKAFLIGVAFNIVANMFAIPLFSYRGAAVVTVFSEVALLIPFYYSVRTHLGPLPWVAIAWRPVAASAAMAGVMWVLRGIPWILLIPAGGLVYVAVLAIIGGFRQPDMDLIFRLLPLDRLRARLGWVPGVGTAGK
jgi:O-antigen/teichoic acid export membrane protein